MWNFPLLPERASTISYHVDYLLLFVLGVSVFFSIAIAIAILYFAIKYRAGAPDVDRKAPPDNVLSIEIWWTVIPLAITMVIFVWGVLLFLRMRTPPSNAMEIWVVGKQWMWKAQHPEGPREINALHIPINRPIKLTMTSEDVLHNFFIPEFRISQGVLPGRYTSQWFQATKPGVYRIFCTQYCGMAHAEMIGKVYALSETEYQQWLSGGGAMPQTLANSGQQLFEKYGCATCHLSTNQGRCPTLVGLYGSKVRLEGGRTVLADEAYIRESILKPQAKRVAGYPDIMPTFQGQLNEEALVQLLTYIKSLKGK